MTTGGSSIPEVRSLLSVLAAGRRAAEAGTAFGDGARAMATTAESLVTVEIDEARATHAAAALQDLPNVTLLVGDWRELLPRHAPFGLLFLDSGGFREDPAAFGPPAVELLEAGGFLVKDDMIPDGSESDPVREFLFGHEQLRAVEVRTTATASAIVAVRI